jgi:NTE family protein
MKNKHLKHIIYIIITLFLTQCSHHNPTIKKDLSQAEAQTKLKQVDVALVLGGGGSRGFSHVGAVEVLEENNIPINLIVGSSAGSAVGAIYADNQDIKKTKSILFKATKKDLLDFSFADTLKMFSSLNSPVRGEAYENFISQNLNAKNFSDLKVPLVVVTVDSETGKKFIINNGPIARAVRASSAIPPVIAPINIYNRLLFDGGIIEPVPVATAKLYNPKLIIAIDINNLPPKTKATNMLELTYRALWLSYYELSRMQARLADIDIHPDLSDHGTFEDHKKEELYQLGRQAALRAIPRIKKKLKKLNIKLSNPE